MLSEQQARAIVLALHDGYLRDGKPERFVVYFCELSANGDYWVVRSNSEDYVVHGKTEYCYVGVNAHLVDVLTGAVETVCSAISVEEYLQDKYDLRTAGENLYVLTPTFSRENKPELINLRQKLECSYPQALMLINEQRQWLTGRRRYLECVQQLLVDQGISTRIELHSESGQAIAIGVECWHIGAALKALRSRIAAFSKSDQVTQ